MDSKLQKRKHLKPNITNKPQKSKAKPYWNSELQESWNETCRCEKIWLSNKRGITNKTLKEEYRIARRRFDKLNRK